LVRQGKGQPIGRPEAIDRSRLEAAPGMSPESVRFEMRIDPKTLSRVDEWRRKQADLLSRAEAIRRLVELGLKAKGGKR
jgi:hypothetical protein